MSAYKWVQSLTDGNKQVLGPVEGSWGKFYAGSLQHDMSCIVIPLGEYESFEVDSGLFEVRTETRKGIGPVMVIEWNYSNDHDLAMGFIDDFTRTKDFLEAPIEAFNKKAGSMEGF